MDMLDNIAQYPIYFAPGCKLLQLQPKLVSDVYDYLRKLFGNIHLYTRCCVLDDAQQHDEEAVFITLCDSCFKIYGETYANLHMRNFWDVYAEYKNVYPLGDEEGKLKEELKTTFCGSVPAKHMRTWYEEWQNWSVASTEKN